MSTRPAPRTGRPTRGEVSNEAVEREKKKKIQLRPLTCIESLAMVVPVARLDSPAQTTCAHVGAADV